MAASRVDGGDSGLRPGSPRMLVSLLIVLLCTACNSGAEVEFSPKFIPLRISIDTQGNVSVTTRGIPFDTPIGTFEVRPYVSGSLFPDKRTLTVRYDGWDTIYELKEGEYFKVEFDKALFESIVFEYDPEGDIFLQLRSVHAAAGPKDEPEMVPDPDTEPAREPAASSEQVTNPSTETDGAAHSSSLAVDDFEHYGNNAAVGAAYSINSAWGKNTASLTLAAQTNAGAGGHSAAFSYEIRNQAPDDYAGFERSFPAQNWQPYSMLHVWIKSDRSNKDLVIQFGEASGEVWRYRINLSTFSAEELWLPLDESTFRWADWSSPGNRRIDRGSINYLGFFVGNGGLGSGVIYIDDITLQ